MSSCKQRGQVTKQNLRNLGTLNLDLLSNVLFIIYNYDIVFYYCIISSYTISYCIILYIVLSSS